MSLESLHPFAGNHAIQSMAFALRWAEPLSPSQIGVLRSRARAFEGYPHLSDRTHLSINMTDGHAVGQSPQVSNSFELNGFSLDSAARRSDGAPAVSIVVEKEEAIIAFREYSRWESISQQASSILSLFSGSDADTAIIVLGLQFSDVFEWRETWDSFSESQVFNEGNPYMAPNVFSSKLNWHSHHGFVDEITEPVELQRINTINVSRETRKSRRLIKITTSHQMRLKSSLTEWTGTNQGILWQCWNGSHEKNKDILLALLTKPVLDKISLK
jgi:uncharacterized protein (TIGR04255 family)